LQTIVWAIDGIDTNREYGNGITEQEIKKQNLSEILKVIDEICGLSFSLSLCPLCINMFANIHFVCMPIPTILPTFRLTKTQYCPCAALSLSSRHCQHENSHQHSIDYHHNWKSMRQLNISDWNRLYYNNLNSMQIIEDESDKVQ
jgi:hypothetical protein